jgi:hypothetical protein
VLNCFEQLGHWNEILALGGPKRVDLDEGSSTPTQTHDFGYHSNGYGHSRIALTQS